MVDGSKRDESAAAIEAAFRALIEGAGAAEPNAALASVVRLATDPRGPLTPPPSRRRPQRAEVVTLEVRADLLDASPPLWRRLELASNMYLDELHQVLQIAFDWTDSHLHRFAVGGSAYDLASEKFLCPFDVEEGDEDGVPERDVRLDELLVEPGDTLTYVYDYGDDWEIRLQLEAVLDRASDAPRALATGGRRAAPPEDFGGVYAYDEAVRDGVDSEPEQIDLEALNDALAGHAAYARVLVELPVELRLLLAHCVGDAVHDTLLELVLEAGLGTSALVTHEHAVEATARYRVLLELLGVDGVKLTSAGYLPPAIVSSVYVTLGLDDEWIGKGNREDMTIPVLTLRQSAVKLGLLRKSRGVLVPTKAGVALASDPVAMWRHLAARLPLEGEGTAERLVALIHLLGLSAGRNVSAGSFRAVVARAVTAAGWRAGAGPVTPDALFALDLPTYDVLRHVGSYDQGVHRRRSELPSEQGKILARAVLQHLADLG